MSGFPLDVQCSDQYEVYWGRIPSLADFRFMFPKTFANGTKGNVFHLET